MNKVLVLLIGLSSITFAGGPINLRQGGGNMFGGMTAPQGFYSGVQSNTCLMNYGGILYVVDCARNQQQQTQVISQNPVQSSAQPPQTNNGNIVDNNFSRTGSVYRSSTDVDLLKWLSSADRGQLMDIKASENFDSETVKNKIVEELKRLLGVSDLSSRDLSSVDSKQKIATAVHEIMLMDTFTGNHSSISESQKRDVYLEAISKVMKPGTSDLEKADILDIASAATTDRIVEHKDENIAGMRPAPERLQKNQERVNTIRDFTYQKQIQSVASGNMKDFGILSLLMENLNSQITETDSAARSQQIDKLSDEIARLSQDLAQRKAGEVIKNLVFFNGQFCDEVKSCSDRSIFSETRTEAARKSLQKVSDQLYQIQVGGKEPASVLSTRSK